MNSISFTNFRRFPNFPKLEFGKITLLVGCNNAGKSTLQKAISFLLANIKEMEPRWGWNSLPDFIIPESMGTYSRVNCKSTKSPMTFEMSFGLCSDNQTPRFKIFFELEEAADNAKKVGIKFLSLTDMEVRYRIGIKFREISVEWIDYSNQNYAEIVANSRSSIFIQDPKNLALDQMIALWKENIIQSEKVESPADFECMLADWEEGLDQLIHLRSYRLNEAQIGNENMFNKKVLLQLMPLSCFDYSAYIHRTSYLLTDTLEQLSRYNTSDISESHGDELSDSIRSRIHESQLDLCEILNRMNIEILPAHSLEKTVFYQSNHPLYPLLNKVCEINAEPYIVRTGELRRSEIDKRILSFIKIFNLAEDFRIRSIEGIAITCELKDKNGNWIHLCEMGSGTLRLMELFLFIACSNSNLLFIEEPEQNLHPKYQSLLADLFSMVDKQIIVETHSEYLVRRTQVLVSQMNLSEEDIDTDNPFKVYYFPEEGILYDMLYLPSGQFEEAFGEGFFDEAGKWTRELIRNRKK